MGALLGTESFTGLSSRLEEDEAPVIDGGGAANIGAGILGMAGARAKPLDFLGMNAIGMGDLSIVAFVALLVNFSGYV